jgi:WD40 repeat protein
MIRAKFHPKKQLLATASDDRTWKLWSFPSLENVMTAQAHKDWVSDIDFHPRFFITDDINEIVETYSLLALEIIL